MKGLTPAEQVLKRLGVTDPAEIDLDAIAWALGAKVRYRPLDGCEARIIGHGDQAIITVNDRSQPRRKRFSLAHELGHWKFHRGKLLVCRPEDIGHSGIVLSALERMADSYAADLLMPNYLFDRVARSYTKLNFQTIHAIADVFNVSRTATAIRMIELRHAPAVLVCHGPQGRKWFARSNDVPDHWFPRDDLDPEGFAFGILFGNQLEDRMPRRIGADAWFNRFDASHYEVHEQTLRTGDNEILTLILITDDEMLSEQEGRSRWRATR